MLQNLKAVNILLRLSIASVFLYAAVAATLQPQNWIWYFPQFARDMIPQQLLIEGFASYQVTLSLWVLSGKKTFYAASLASLTFLGIIAANFSILDVLFRDFAIFFASLALAVGTYKQGSKLK
jgi:hypothetical protein